MQETNIYILLVGDEMVILNALLLTVEEMTFGTVWRYVVSIVRGNDLYV